jgi:hypothetical protein
LLLLLNPPPPSFTHSIYTTYSLSCSSLHFLPTPPFPSSTIHHLLKNKKQKQQKHCSPHETQKPQRSKSTS